jgi:hypothetical protein
MGRTTVVNLSSGGYTALPPMGALTARRSILVENNGPNAIWVGYDAGTLAAGMGHKVAPGTSREFPSDILYGIAETADQTGVANDCTIVSEVT